MLFLAKSYVFPIVCLYESPNLQTVGCGVDFDPNTHIINLLDRKHSSKVYRVFWRGFGFIVLCSRYSAVWSIVILNWWHRYKYVIIYCYVVPTILLCLFVIVCRPKDASVVREFFRLDFSGFMISSILPPVPMQSARSLSSRWRTSSADLVLASLSYASTKRSRRCSLPER